MLASLVRLEEQSFDNLVQCMAFVVVFASVLTSALAFVARHIALVDLTYNNFGCSLAMHMLVGKVTGIEEEGRTAGRLVLQHLPRDLY